MEKICDLYTSESVSGATERSLVYVIKNLDVDQRKHGRRNIFCNDAKKLSQSKKYWCSGQKIQKYIKKNMKDEMMPKNLLKIKRNSVPEKRTKVDEGKYRRRNIYPAMMTKNFLKLEDNDKNGRKGFRNRQISR